MFKGVGVNVSLILIQPYATNNNKKVAQYHMIIKLINISYRYITNFLHIN